jgi:hypothetical protein
VLYIKKKFARMEQTLRQENDYFRFTNTQLFVSVAVVGIAVAALIMSIEANRNASVAFDLSHSVHHRILRERLHNKSFGSKGEQEKEEEEQEKEEEEQETEDDNLNVVEKPSSRCLFS